MKAQTLLLPFFAAQSVLANRRVQSAETAFTESNVADLLMYHPNILPANGRLMLQERLKGHVKRLAKRQSSTLLAILGSLAAESNTWDTKRPNTKIPMEQISPSPDWPGAMRKKIRYGPYRLPPTSEENLESKILNVKGMTNALLIGALKPCSGDCLILTIKPSMEYADGKVADTDTGAWLHHAVLINAGLGVQDYTCPNGLESFMEHLFESGNERTVIPYALANGTTKSGYHLRSGDSFIINTELMNMDNKEKWAWLTLEFDYIDDPTPDYMEGKVIWMSVGPNRCTAPDDNPFGPTNLTFSQQPTRMTFEESSIPWDSVDSGLILGANGHLHEGATALKVFQNGKEICNSLPTYGKGTGGSMAGMGMRLRKREDTPFLAAQRKLKPIMAPTGYTNSDIEYIVEQSFCTFNNPLKVNTEDSMHIRVDYDYTQHKGMINKKGQLDEVMGIAGVLMAFPYQDPMAP